MCVSDLETKLTPTKNMGRTVKEEKIKPGSKRTRGRPRAKESKPAPVAKRQKRSLSTAHDIKSPDRDRSSSPTQQEPPQLELMPAVEEDDVVPIGLSSLISIDDHLRPGKCILICPLTSCRKRFSNPIELVSHLRVYHTNESLPSLKIYACPLCLPTHFSSHTTSSELTLLSEHAVRYHGKTYTQVRGFLPFIFTRFKSEFLYFCTIVLDVNTGDKATQKKDAVGALRKEAVSITSQTTTENLYHPILPLVPNSSSTDIRFGKSRSSATLYSLNDKTAHLVWTSLKYLFATFFLIPVKQLPALSVKIHV